MLACAVGDTDASSDRHMFSNTLLRYVRSWDDMVTEGAEDSMAVDDANDAAEYEKLSDFLSPLYLQSFVVKIASSMLQMI